VLDQFAAAPFPPGYPTDRRTFYAPIDNVHGVLVFVVTAAQSSLDLAMYGFDDDELAAALTTKLKDPGVTVRLTLDSSEATGVHEKEILTSQSYPSSDIAIGTSEKGAIMHLKELIVDATILVTGSTNWSTSAQIDQDNQLTVAIDPVGAALAVARHSAIHASMLKQSAAPTGGNP
jgi:phosphatidylserine/phosphatidylglycerophosphate/cardiolipin synthase-like enzyme